MRRIGILAAALSFGFAGAAVGQPADASIELISADTPVTTASGATFTAPSGWRVTSTASKKVLEPPEADSHLALVDVRAADAAAAVAAGWASYRPDANRPLRTRDAAGAAEWLGRAALSTVTRSRPTRRPWSTRWPGGRAGLDGRDRRGKPRDLREAQRRLFARDRQPASQGIPARDVQRARRPTRWTPGGSPCSRISSRT